MICSVNIYYTALIKFSTHEYFKFAIVFRETVREPTRELDNYGNDDEFDPTYGGIFSSDFMNHKAQKVHVPVKYTPIDDKQDEFDWNLTKVKSLIYLFEFCISITITWSFLR